MNVAMDMDMPTTTAMDMPMDTSTSMTGDMDGMTMSMADMIMVFFTSYTTPLFSASWNPTSEGQYAGTCIFLIVLAFALRFMLAVKPILEARFWSSNIKRDSDGDGLLEHDEVYNKNDTAQVVAVARRDFSRRWSGWRVGPSAARATYELAIAGVGYLL